MSTETEIPTWVTEFFQNGNTYEGLEPLAIPWAILNFKNSTSETEVADHERMTEELVELVGLRDKQGEGKIENINIYSRLEILRRFEEIKIHNIEAGSDISYWFSPDIFKRKPRVEVVVHSISPDGKLFIKRKNGKKLNRANTVMVIPSDLYDKEVDGSRLEHPILLKHKRSEFKI